MFGLNNMIENYDNFLNYIDNICEETNLNATQILYLMFLKHEMKVGFVHIYPEDLLDLVSKDYIFQGRITDLACKVLEFKFKPVNIELIAKNTTLPRLTEPTSNIAKRLASHFLTDLFKGKEYKRYNEDCDNPIMAPFFFIFMNMFPSSNEEANKNWNKHFNTTWTNVNLRRVTTMTIKKFKQVWKTKDIGLFLLGTYLFIQGSHNQEKNVYFVKSLENYWKEYEYWYQMAEDLLDKGELKDFTKPQKKKEFNNQFII
jgi:hypothetical protein